MQKPSPIASRLSRRGFLQAATAAGACGTGLYAYGRTQRRLRLGLIGCGARGRQLAAVIRWTRPRPVYGEITAVCDVHRLRAESLRNDYCASAEIYGDDRRLLERDDLDGVIIATPDHWHARLSLQALKNDKAVYCEKPLTLTVDEGRRLVAASQRYGRAFQVGTQQRSDWRFQTACELVRNGRLGEIHRVEVRLPTGSLPPTSFGGPFDRESPPAELDWDRWLGQAPAVEFCRQRFDPFRWWFEYGGGFVADWGAHHLDIVHWALGLENSGPTSIDGRGELPQIENGYNTPRRFSIDLRYAGGVEVNVEPNDRTNGIRFVGEQGEIFVGRRQLTGAAVDALASTPLPPYALRYYRANAPWGTPNYLHMLDFFTAIDRGTPTVSDVASQHRSATACHLSNISLRLGRPIRWNPETEQIDGDPEATALLSRPQRAGYEVS